MHSATAELKLAFKQQGGKIFNDFQDLISPGDFLAHTLQILPFFA